MHELTTGLGGCPRANDYRSPVKDLTIQLVCVSRSSFADRRQSEKAFLILHALQFAQGPLTQVYFFETKEIKILADIGGERQTEMRFARK